MGILGAFMKKCLISLLVLMLILAGSALAQLRTFKDTTGRETRASIDSVSNESVNLITASGKLYTVPLERFSEADRTFITDWAKKNPGSAAISSLLFEVKSDRRKIPNPRGKLDPKYSKIADSNTFYEILIENPTRESVPEMRMEYVIYKRDYVRTDGKRTKFEIVETKKEQTIGTIGAGEKRELKTVTVLAHTRIQKADREKDIPEVNTSETVLGIVVDFFVRDRKIKTVPYPKNMLIKMQEGEEREERKRMQERGRRGSDSLPSKSDSSVKSKGGDLK